MDPISRMSFLLFSGCQAELFSELEGLLLYCQSNCLQEIIHLSFPECNLLLYKASETQLGTLLMPNHRRQKDNLSFGILNKFSWDIRKWERKRKWCIRDFHPIICNILPHIVDPAIINIITRIVDIIDSPGRCYGTASCLILSHLINHASPILSNELSNTSVWLLWNSSLFNLLYFIIVWSCGHYYKVWQLLGITPHWWLNAKPLLYTAYTQTLSLFSQTIFLLSYFLICSFFHILSSYLQLI